MVSTIDLNCDVGEGIDNESHLFPFISSCNIATGGHAGDTTTMAKVAQMAQAHQVRIGAHPSYPDRANFGRVSLKMDKTAFQESIKSQLESIVKVLVGLGLDLSHIKAHGALYNDLSRGGVLADAYLDALESFRVGHILYVPFGSEFARMAKLKGFHIWNEAFADRAYQPDGGLVSRSQQGAVLTDPSSVCDQVLEMIIHKRVKCSDGSLFRLQPDTLCLHGDNPQAREILEKLSKVLSENSIQIKK